MNFQIFKLDVEKAEGPDIKLPTSIESESENESCSVVSDSLQPHGLYSPWNSPGKNTRVGSLSLLQGIFPTQGLNPGLWHCRWILYQLILCFLSKAQTSIRSLKKQEGSRKTSTSPLLTTPKPSTVWITANCGKFLKRWEYQTT